MQDKTNCIMTFNICSCPPAGSPAVTCTFPSSTVLTSPYPLPSSFLFCSPPRWGAHLPAGREADRWTKERQTDKLWAQTMPCHGVAPCWAPPGTCWPHGCWHCRRWAVEPRSRQRMRSWEMETWECPAGTDGSDSLTTCCPPDFGTSFKSGKRATRTKDLASF